MPVSRGSPAVLGVFVACCLAHLTVLLLGAGWPVWASKAALMPALAGWAWSRGAPRTVVVALLLSGCGDVAMAFHQIPRNLVLGMGFFAAAHCCYVWTFARAGWNLAPSVRRWVITSVYAAVWLAVVVLLWPGLGVLRLPMVLYSLLLTATAITSAVTAPGAGAGGALFLVSDVLIGLGLADLPGPPGGQFWVMLTYLLAQYLLASGAMVAADRAGDRGGDPGGDRGGDRAGGWDEPEQSSEFDHSSHLESS